MPQVDGKNFRSLHGVDGIELACSAALWQRLDCRNEHAPPPNCSKTLAVLLLLREGVSTDSQLGSEYDLHPCDWTIRQPKGRQPRFKLTETYWKLLEKSGLFDMVVYVSTFVLLYALASPYLPGRKVDRHLYDDN